MKPVFTRLFWLVCLSALTLDTLAQETLDPRRIQWTAPLSGSVIKTLVDASGNVWACSAPNNFQVVGSDGKTRWTKALSSLTVADFAVDSTGQLVIIGSPASGSPVAERYDASQTRVWSNRLDSLSGDVSQLSIALSGAGGSVAFGTNARNSQRISYYFILANGSLGTFTNVVADKAGPVKLVKPVVFNKKEMIFGVDQPTVPDAVPLYYRLQVEATTVAKKAISNAYRDSRFSYVSLALGNSVPVNEPVMLNSSSLLTDGKYVMSLVQVRYNRSSTSPADTTTVQGAVARSIVSPTDYDEPFYYGYRNELFKRGVVATMAASLGQLQIDQSTFVTAQVVQRVGTGLPVSDITINQYQVQPTYTNTGPFLTDSLQIGLAYSAQAANADKPVIKLLRRTANGTLLLAGATSGTMIIGGNRFVGSASMPIHFLMAIGAEQVRQQLVSEQVPYSLTLPGTNKRVLTNAQGRVWVQLTNGTFRAYNAQGTLLWEKQLNGGNANVDDRNNLYVADGGSISRYDSTGDRRWTINSDVTINGAFRYEGRLVAGKPGGGGIWIDLYGATNGALNGFAYRLVINEFDIDGRVINQATYADGFPVYSSLGVRQILARPDGQFTFVLDNTFQRTIVSNTSYIVQYRSGQKNIQLSAYLGGYPTDVTNTNAINYSFGPSGPQVVRAGVDNRNRLYASVGQVFNYALDVVNQYTFFTLDSTGNKVASAVGTPFAYRMATAAAQTVTPDGTIFTIQPAVRTSSAQSTTLNVVLSEYASSYALRNTIQLGTLIQPNSLTTATTFEIVKAYADGSMLLTGVTTGTLAIGGATFTGSIAAPVRFLVRLSPYLLTTAVSTTSICAGSSASLSVRAKGYMDQPIRLELSRPATDAGGTVLSVVLPVNQSALVDTTLSAISLPLPATLTAGTYWTRLSSGSLASAWQSLPVIALPASPTATQQGDNLVATGGTQYQWLDSQKQAISGANDARYRPQMSGSYYVVNRIDGCQSAPSAAVVYVITATEPLAELTVYPNPATDRLWIRWPGAGANAHIRLIDAQGRVLTDVRRQGEVTELPLKQSAPGLYLLQLSADAQPVQVRKVLIK